MRKGILNVCFGIVFTGIAVTTFAADGVLYEQKGKSGKPTVVLAHDWFGDSEFYREFGARLVSEGFTVIATDLYEGKEGGRTHAEAWNLMKELTEAHAATVLERAIVKASKSSETVVVIGFSMGAPHALAAASRHGSLVDASVIFYGDAITDQDRLAKLGGPVLAIYGSKDGTYGKPAADVAAEFSKAADEAGTRAEIVIYPGAAHAFAQPLFNAGKTYDKDAALSAWNVLMDFLSRV